MGLDTMALDVTEVRVRVDDASWSDGLSDWERVDMARKHRRSMLAGEQELADVAAWLDRKRGRARLA